MYPEEAGIKLICPDCRQPLLRRETMYVCTGEGCRRAYPIIDEIPKLVVGDEPPLDLEAWKQAIR
ncbi:MAG: hypothetical protein R3B90_21195 [Planctomycetaceae bacterium]